METTATQAAMYNTPQPLSPLGLSTHFYKFKEFVLFIDRIGYGSKVDPRLITYDNMEGFLDKFRPSGE